MGRQFFEHLTGQTYTCCQCSTHLARYDELVSKQFYSRNGRAYLFNSVVNVLSGPLEQRPMATGLHVVSDIYCNGCHALVGWKYKDAQDKSQKYKEGKFVLEKACVALRVEPGASEDEGMADCPASGHHVRYSTGSDSDSDDCA